MPTILTALSLAKDPVGFEQLDLIETPGNAAKPNKEINVVRQDAPVQQLANTPADESTPKHAEPVADQSSAPPTIKP